MNTSLDMSPINPHAVVTPDSSAYQEVVSLEHSIKDYEARVAEFEELGKSIMAFQQANPHSAALSSPRKNAVSPSSASSVVRDDSSSISVFSGYNSKDEVVLAQATALNNMGFLYQKKEMNSKQKAQTPLAIPDNSSSDKALAAYKKALKLKKETLGSNHVSVATTLNNMGSVYFSRGDYNKAIKAYSKALTVMTHILGGEHLSVATVHNNIGDVHYCVGDDARALRSYTAAFNIRELHLPQDDIRVSRLHDKICLILWRRDVQEAILIEKASDRDENDLNNLKDQVTDDLNWLDTIASDLNRDVDTQCKKLSPVKSKALTKGLKRQRCVIESGDEREYKVNLLAASSSENNDIHDRKKRRVALTVWSTRIE